MLRRLPAFHISFMLLALLAASGCVAAKSPFSPPGALLYTSVKAPLQVDLPEGGVAYTTECGTASTMYFHDPIITGMDFAWDDCSIQTAARNGNLKSVYYADYEVFNFFLLFGVTTVYAYGSVSE